MRFHRSLCFVRMGLARQEYLRRFGIYKGGGGNRNAVDIVVVVMAAVVVVMAAV
jgi:hypothetical protein